MTGKNDPLRNFGIRSCTSPAWVASTRGLDPFAFRHSGIGVFIAAGADPLGGLGLDQLLHHQPHNSRIRSTPPRHGTPRAAQLRQTGTTPSVGNLLSELAVHTENLADGPTSQADSPATRKPPLQGTLTV